MCYNNKMRYRQTSPERSGQEIDPISLLRVEGEPNAEGPAIIILQGILSDSQMMSDALTDKMKVSLEPKNITYVDYNKTYADGKEPLSPHEDIVESITSYLADQLQSNPGEAIHVVGMSFGARMLPGVMQQLRQRAMHDETLSGHVALTFFDAATNPKDVRVTRTGAKIEQLTGINVDRVAKEIASRALMLVDENSWAPRLLNKFLTRPPLSGYTRGQSGLNSLDRIRRNYRAYLSELAMVKTSLDGGLDKWLSQSRRLLNDHIPLDESAGFRAGGLSVTVATITNDHNNQIVPGRRWLEEIKNANKGQDHISAAIPHCAFFADDYAEEAVRALGVAGEVHENKITNK